MGFSFWVFAKKHTRVNVNNTPGYQREKTPTSLIEILDEKKGIQQQKFLKAEKNFFQKRKISVEKCYFYETLPFYPHSISNLLLSAQF